VLGLGGNGNLSDAPELGGLKAESGRRGRVFRPLRRRPTWGGEGGVGICVLIVGEEIAGSGDTYVVMKVFCVLFWAVSIRSDR